VTPQPNRLRLAVLYSHPVQYVAPLLRELGRRPDVDLTVYFLSRHGLDDTFDPQFGKSFKWDIPLLEGYKYAFLPNLRRTPGVMGFFRLVNTSVVGEIRRQKFDALLVHGYEHLAKWLAFGAARSCGTRLIFRGESHLAEPRTPLRRMIKGVVLRSLFKRFAGVTYIGSLNRSYFEYYGVDAARLHFAPYSVDNDFFSEAVARLSPARTDLRNAIGVTDQAPIILYVGKLIDVKQPELLLQAFADVRKRHACHLVFVGDGALRGRIEAAVRESRIPDVLITGFVNQTRIPEMYASADIFVLPSRHEPWGLAVNEAMAAGLPVIVSDRVGCSVDLVNEGVNGHIVPYDQVGELAQKLEHLVANPRLRNEFGNRSRKMIADWSVAKTADGIMRAARA
jgi:glycosyltransferase involved in cell wall biosynthesis